MNTSRLCFTLASLMSQNGISEVVVSSGSRNAPIIAALESYGNFKLTPVVDERSAAFIAMGKAMIKGECVALVCTSGTAVLNYGPAIAEALYRNIKLLVISADRPIEWINRNDAQTIVQNGLYKQLGVASFDISQNYSDRFIINTIEESINCTRRFQGAPVHLNIQIETPAINEIETDNNYNEPRATEFITSPMILDTTVARRLATIIAPPKRIMVVAGCMPPSQRLSRALSRLCSFGNCVVIADNVSNLHGKGIYTGVVSLFSHCEVNTIDELTPDIVISIGGPIISSHLKEYLRTINVEHWHIGLEELLQDTYGKISLNIETTPETFFSQIVSLSRKTGLTASYTSKWEDYTREVYTQVENYLKDIAWSDLKAVTTILSKTPRSFNLQLSNGMTSRYAQILPIDFHRIDCNRGVSGIDGSISTAIGASSEYSGNTLLVTGDMSAQYDIGCLTTGQVPSNLKIVVINNGGGGIFNFIKGTRNHNITDRYLRIKGHYNIGSVAHSSGIKVFYASDLQELKRSIPEMLHYYNSPAMMVVNTDGNKSAMVLTDFLKRNN